MDCPRCQIEIATGPYRGSDVQHQRGRPLHAITHAAGVQIDACDGCGGSFLDHGELQKIQNAARHTAQSYEPTTSVQRIYARGRDRARSVDGAGTEPSPELRCPACGGEMALREWGFGSDVTVDTCIECRGVWLDFTEIEALEALFR